MKKLLCLLLLPCVFILLSFVPHKPLTWVAVGDSITYLNDHLDETGNRVTKGYLSRVVEKLPYIHYINQGHNGWTSGNIARKIGQLGLVSADVYTVFLGTNDWWNSNPIGKWEDYTNNTGDTTVYGSFRIIIDRLRSLNKDARIILITPMQRADFVYINDPKNNAYGSYRPKAGQTLEQVVEAIEAIAAHEQLQAVDLYHNKELALPRLVKFKHLKDSTTGIYHDYTYPSYIGLPFHPGKDEYPYPPAAIGMTYDGLHPSDAGNEVVARELTRVMRKL